MRADLRQQAESGQAARQTAAVSRCAPQKARWSVPKVHQLVTGSAILADVAGQFLDGETAEGAVLGS